MNPSESRGFLQERFEGFEPEPERDLWPAIESEIRYRKRAARIPWPYVGVAASVLIMAGALIMLWPGQPEPAPYATTEEQALPQAAAPGEQAAPAPDEAERQPACSHLPPARCPKPAAARNRSLPRQARAHRPSMPSRAAQPCYPSQRPASVRWPCQP